MGAKARPAPYLDPLLWAHERERESPCNVQLHVLNGVSVLGIGYVCAYDLNYYRSSHQIAIKNIKLP